MLLVIKTVIYLTHAGYPNNAFIGFMLSVLPIDGVIRRQASLIPQGGSGLIKSSTLSLWDK